MIIALEGLPGAGKTTAVGRAAKCLRAIPVCETTGDHPFLAQVYDDARRDDFTVELAFLLVHANAYRRIPPDRRVLCDFSPVKDQLFAEDMLTNREREFFMTTYEFIYRGHRIPDLVVYLRAEPELCLERVRSRLNQNRTRSFELGMTLDRLSRMRDRYEATVDRLGDMTLIYDVVDGKAEDEVAKDLVELLLPIVDSRPA